MQSIDTTLRNTMTSQTITFSSQEPSQEAVTTPPLSPTSSQSIISSSSSSNSSHPANMSNSPFLALPPELRNEIYTLLLTSDYIPTLRQLSARGHAASDYILPSPYLSPALLSVCRQISAEALPILYGQNTFAAHPSLLASLPYLISPRRPVIAGPGLRKIRKWYIGVRLDVDPKFSAAQATEAFSGADEFEIDVFQAMYGSCDYSVLMLFDGVRGVGKARVSCSTGCGSYARWLEQAMMKPIGEAVAPFGEVDDWEPWTRGNR